MQQAMTWRDCGLMPYQEAWALQEQLRQRRLEGRCGDWMLLVEHPPVITLGRRDTGEDLMTPAVTLAREKIDIVRTNRGGRATFHEPGQLVVYCIWKLTGRGLGVRAFVHLLEEVGLRVLRDIGIEAERDRDYPGLWVGGEKIMATGVHVGRGITQHGFSLNVDCSLETCKHIVACGIAGRGVTTMARCVGARVSMQAVKGAVIRHVSSLLHCDMLHSDGAEGEARMQDESQQSAGTQAIRM